MQQPLVMLKRVNTTEINVKTFKEFIAEEKAFQGTFKVKYDELDMKNPAKDAADRVAEDDGPHTYKKAETPNFTTVVDPATVVNQPNSKGNVDVNMSVEKKGPGKPMKKLSAATKKSSLHPEDLTGAVAGVAIGEETEKLFELSPMTKKIYLRKATAAKQTHLQKAKENENSADIFSFSNTTRFKRAAASERYKALKRQRGIDRAKSSIKEGSARGAYTRRGEYAKTRETHLTQADTSEKSRGVVQKPTADARSYSRTHTTPYNKGSAEYEADRKRGESLKSPKQKETEKLPVNPEGASDRIKDILNHPQYKKLGKKQ